MDPEFFKDVDAVLSCSEFTRQRYKNQIGLESAAIPLPIDPEDCIAPERDPKYLTIVNPTREKGQMFIVTFVEEMAHQHPEIPILIVESCGKGMARCANNVTFRPMVQQPKDWARDTRVLLVPSVWEEPAGRVVAESLLNGISPIVSGRGGLIEMCNGAGFVAPLPASYTTETAEPVSKETVQQAIELTALLFETSREFRELSLNASKKYDYNTVADRYAVFFRSLL